MTTIRYLFMLVCLTFFIGCHAENQRTKVKVQEEEAPPATPKIEILNLSLTDKTLTLDFRVTNPLEDDIWICYDIAVYGKQDVQHAATRIDGDMVRVILQCNAAHPPGFINPPPVGKYIRLAQGESCSWRIVRSLPIKDDAREWRESRKEHKEIVLHRVAFEAGYFGPKWTSVLDSRFEMYKEQAGKLEPEVDGPYYYLPDNPLITEETLGDQRREVMYLNYGFVGWVSNEKSAELVLTDIAVPCSVVIE